MIRLGEGNRCDKSGGKLSSSRDDLMSKSYNRITIISKLLVGDIGAKMFIFSHWKLNDNLAKYNTVLLIDGKLCWLSFWLKIFTVVV